MREVSNGDLSIANQEKGSSSHRIIQSLPNALPQLWKSNEYWGNLMQGSNKMKEKKQLKTLPHKAPPSLQKSLKIYWSIYCFFLDDLLFKVLSSQLCHNEGSHRYGIHAPKEQLNQAGHTRPVDCSLWQWGHSCFPKADNVNLFFSLLEVLEQYNTSISSPDGIVQ